ncbi:hypothetical protein FKW77_004958 [Venturia effusa]|uniref:Aminotransferase class V domain-containing protein n=1 Tax=Venturia effusa TaxID=50376 RepID=A0A517L985_9PEZI|nr:hypothetical protein FKW77_004958 [Venturia effusa]
MTGRRLPLTWARQLRNSKCNAYTLLDAAALSTCTQLELDRDEPDFTAVSFYKIFGMPDIGALIIRKGSAHMLRKRRYFGGGTVEMVIVLDSTWHAKKSEDALHDELEEGTLPFHSIIALGHAMDVHRRLFTSMTMISAHTNWLGKYTYDFMTSMRHSNNAPVFKIYKDDDAIYGDAETQGATVAFNILRSDGSLVPFTEVEAAADKENIYVRSGGLCNPGGIATYLEWKQRNLRRAYDAGHRCNKPTALVQGRPTGVVRVSLGAMSLKKDVDAFMGFVKDKFVDRAVEREKQGEAKGSLEKDAETVASLSDKPGVDLGGESGTGVSKAKRGRNGKDSLARSWLQDRKGWDVSTWRWSTEDVGFDLNGRTIQEMSSFLQSWLFFGLLRSVLDVPITRTDFIRHDFNNRQFITTTALPKYLGDWKTRYDEHGEEEQATIVDTIHEYLAEATTVNNMLTYLLFYGNDVEDSDVLKQTLFVNMLLTDALQGTSTRLLQKRDNNPTPQQDTFLRHHMIASGWCISTVEYMQDNLPLQEQAYAFSLGSVRALQDHSKCKKDVATGCMLGRVGEKFEPLHVEDNCCCEMISPPIEEVASMLMEGLIPLITIVRAEDDSSCLQLLVDGIELLPREPHEVYPYFAVSHVWSDGLGNPQGNSLPRCQLLRIESMAKSIGENALVYTVSKAYDTAAHKHGTVAFWFDTLCIPVQPKYQHLRDFSIQKMQEIYLAAGGVLVLDPDLQRLSSTARNVEVLSRVMTSGWRSRLWTFQEGMLAHELLIPGKVSCFTLNGEEDLSLGPGTIAYGIIEQLLMSTLWWKYSYLIWNIATKFDIVRDPLSATRVLLKAVAHRRTTRPGDEAICIATFLGLDPTTLLHATIQHRMPILIKLLRTIPAHILFTWGRRLENLGFRWAPTTFLSPFGLHDADQVSLPLSYAPDRDDPKTRVPMPTPILRPSGLSVFFPALQVRASSIATQAIPEVFSIHTSNADGGTTTWLVEARDTGSGIPWSAVIPPNISFAILLSRPTSGGVSIITQIVGDEADAHGSIPVRWRGMVSVNNVEECLEDASMERGEECCLEGEYVPFRWWIVD